MGARILIALGLSIATASCSQPDDAPPVATAWIAHLSADGEMAWGADVERCWSSSVGLLAPRPEGGWVGVGGGNDGPVFAALDAAGRLLVRHLLDNDATVSALAASAGGAVLALSRPAAPPRVLRIGVDDETVWHHDIYTEGVRVNAIAEISGGGVVAIGATLDADTNDHDPWVSRLDAQGELVWETTLPGDDDVELLSGVQSAEGIVAAGRRRGPGWESVRVVALDLEGEVEGTPLDIGELAGAQVVTVEVAPDSDVAILANQDFESLLFERWRISAKEASRVARLEWPDPWLVGTELRAGADGDVGVVSPILGDTHDGAWVRRIDRDGRLTMDARLPRAGDGRALALGPAGLLIGGSTRAAYTERCIR